MRICDLSDGDIIRIVTDLFAPKRITNIRRHKRDGCVSCVVYTEWSSPDENGKEETVTCKDAVELRNPFEAGTNAIWTEGIPLKESDYVKLKQFCFAKGMKPDWMENNPYLEKRGIENGRDADH